MRRTKAPRAIAALLACLILALSLAACGTPSSNDTGEPEPSAGTTEGNGGEAEPPAPEGVELLDVLSLTDWSWEYSDDGTLLYEASWEALALADESALAFPELSAKLDALSAEKAKAMAEQASSMGDAAQLQLEEGGSDYFHEYTSTSAYSVLRADELVMSVREDVSDYAGGMHPLYGVLGLNLNASTGEELSLNDVVLDVDALREKVEAQVLAQYEGLLFDDAADTLSTADSLSNWTVDYQGITFYFNPYELAPFSEGVLQTTVWFDEAPEIFSERLLEAPEGGYVMDLPVNGQVAVDLDPDDGERDCITASFIPVDDWGARGLFVQMNGGDFGDMDCMGYEFDSYLVRQNGEGEWRNWLYVEATSDNDYRSLYVYRLDGGSLESVSVSHGVGLHGVLDESYGEYGGYFTALLGDPSGFVLDTRLDVLSTQSGYRTYYVDFASGAPVTDDEAYALSGTYLPLVSKAPIEVTMLSSGEAAVLDPGTEFEFLRTDNETYVDMQLADGAECRIEVDLSGYPATINGMPDYDVFEELYYAG